MLKIVGLLTAVLLSAAVAAGWTQLTDLPAPPPEKTIEDGGCMAYDAGTDLIFASKGNETGEFYAYDVSGWWVTPYPQPIPLGAEDKQVHAGSVICSDGNGTIYLTKGNKTVGFWSYDAVTSKQWTQKTNVPLGSSGREVEEGAGLAWATKNGVGFVYLLKGYSNEFHKYDPATNTWTQLLDAPIGTNKHWGAGSWLVSDPRPGAHMLYAFKAKYHELYTYDTDLDVWSTAKAQMPFDCDHGNNLKARWGSCAAWYGGNIYAFKGDNTNEFWRYDPLPPPGGEWQEQEPITLKGWSSDETYVKAGGALAGHPGTGVYAFKGDKTLEFWRFTPDDKAGAQPSREGIMAGSSDIGNVSFAIAPNPVSGGLATIRYDLPKAGAARLDIYDVSGQAVMAQTLTARQGGSANLDLRRLNNGVYLVKLQSQGLTVTQRLVVQR